MRNIYIVLDNTKIIHKTPFLWYSIIYYNVSFFLKASDKISHFRTI